MPTRWPTNCCARRPGTAFFDGQELPRTTAQFEARMAQRRGAWPASFRNAAGPREGDHGGAVCGRARAGRCKVPGVHRSGARHESADRAARADGFSRPHTAAASRRRAALHRSDLAQARRTSGAYCKRRAGQRRNRRVRGAPRTRRRQTRRARRPRRRSLPDRGISRRGICAAPAHEGQGVGANASSRCLRRSKKRRVCVEFVRSMQCMRYDRRSPKSDRNRDGAAFDVRGFVVDVDLQRVCDKSAKTVGQGREGPVAGHEPQDLRVQRHRGSMGAETGREGLREDRAASGAPRHQQLLHQPVVSARRRESVSAGQVRRRCKRHRALHHEHDARDRRIVRSGIRRAISCCTTKISVRRLRNGASVAGRFWSLRFSGRRMCATVVGSAVGLCRSPIRYYIDDERHALRLDRAQFIQIRASLLDAEQLISGDRYIFMRDAYLQRRDYLIKDGQVTDEFLDEEWNE